MKKILVFAAVAVISMGSLMAQNKFRGIVNYSITSTGETAIQLKDDMTKAELKVYDNSVSSASPMLMLSTGGMASQIIVNGNKMSMCMDLGMIFMYLQQNDVELDYKGSSKIIATNELTQSEIDSLTIPDNKGMYIEYKDDTKTIAGRKASLAVIHSFDEDGEESTQQIWYAPDMGPAVNQMFTYVKGVPLEFTQDLGEGRQLTYTASEIKEGKVKEVDMLLPSGYETIDEETLKNLFQQIQEEMKYLQE